MTSLELGLLGLPLSNQEIASTSIAPFLSRMLTENA